jgi:putative SOS response-associated peptidase YedK
VAVVAVGPNDPVRRFQDRVPVILSRESYDEWPSPETREARLVSLLRPYPADEMTVAGVGPTVNSPRNGWPEYLDAA